FFHKNNQNIESGQKTKDLFGRKRSFVQIIHKYYHSLLVNFLFTKKLVTSPKPANMNMQAGKETSESIPPCSNNAPIKTPTPIPIAKKAKLRTTSPSPNFFPELNKVAS